MTAEPTKTETTPDLTARRLAAFEKASAAAAKASGVEAMPDDALPKGINPENFQREEPAPVVEETEQQAEPEAPVVDDEDMRLATAALLRSGFDREEIEAMPVEKRLERGLKRQAQIAKNDADHRRLQDLETQKDSATRTADLAPKPESSTPANYEEAVAPFAEQYGLDDGGKKALAAAFQAAVGPLATDVSALKSERASEANQQMAVALGAARSDLAKTFPGLSDDSTFKDVVVTMDLLEQHERFQKIHDPKERALAVMKASAASLGIAQAAQEEIEEETPPKAARTVRVVKSDAATTARKPEPRELSPLEKRYAVFDAITKLPPGSNRAGEARKMAGIN